MEQMHHRSIGYSIISSERRKLGDFLDHYDIPFLKQRPHWFTCNLLGKIDIFLMCLADKIRNNNEGHEVVDKVLDNWVLDCRSILYETMDVFDNFCLQSKEVTKLTTSSNLAETIRNGLMTCVWVWPVDPEVTPIDVLHVKTNLLLYKIVDMYRGVHLYEPDLGKNNHVEAREDDDYVAFEDEFCAIQSFLTQKRSLREWCTMKEQVWQKVESKMFVEIAKLFSSSYDDLSGNLKLCFLYLGIFPSDYIISARMLYCLWIAERFIPKGKKGASVEDVAKEYLIELEHHNLIQVTQWYMGEIVDFKVNNQLTNFIVQKAREWEIFDIFDPQKQVQTRCRRLAVHSHISEFFMLDYCNSKLQTLVLFDIEGEFCLEAKHLEVISENFKSLRVLDMRRVGTLTKNQIPLPMSWNCNMMHLNFLWLPWSDHISRLPRKHGLQLPKFVFWFPPE